MTLRDACISCISGAKYHLTAECPQEGQALDIDPEAGRDRVGARRDKGHRYLRFETQVGDDYTYVTRLTFGQAIGG